ncbi:MAG: hypothetical protein ACD_26C00034G0026 [uncultured bacterium]|nr:MAG: hypothetical protein ACD_26C00034G0026 [uncultured bacterium]
MKNLLKNSYWILLLITTLLVFKNLLIGNLYHGGDVPFFYDDTLINLISDPLVWTERGYSFGGVNLTLWLSPLMVVYGALGKTLSLGNDTVVRILFILPSIVISLIGPILLTRYLKLTNTIQFFTSLVYTFNTYYLLLLDGGQVGVALAYGIFPITLLFLKKFVDNINHNNFIYALLLSFVLSVIDPRILVVCYLTISIWSILEKKFNYWLIVMGVILIFLNSYWILPLLKLGAENISTSISNLGLLSLINPLLLFSPHWPSNIFGKINYPPFYFVGVPILTFGSFFMKKDRQYLIFSIILLIFAFLTKGQSPPLGINLGFIYRDSSKFFIPVVLFAGMMIGHTFDLLKNNLFKFLGFIYIIFLIAPALFGKMNFLMSDNISDPSFSSIAQNIKKQNNYFRTLWFTNKNPLSYESVINPAVDAISLSSFIPFVQTNVGEDQFNFLNDQNYIGWLRILEIKYVFLNGNHRNINLTQTDAKNWDTIKKLVDTSFDSKKIDWNLNFDAYEVTNPYPKFYAVDKLVAIVGSNKLSKKDTYTPAIYFEDGKWDPSTIYIKKPDSLKIYYTDGTKLDLTMSLLQKNFVSPADNKNTTWSVFTNNEYLKYKYQLLIRNINFTDFDYGRGIAFSTKRGESINFNIKIPENGDYILAKRIFNQDSHKLIWQIEEKYLEKGNYNFLINNNDDITVLNVVAIISKTNYKKALTLTDQIITKFGVVTEIDSNNDINKVEMKNVGTSQYSILTKRIGYWVVFSDSYNPLWRLKRGLTYLESYPIYSMLNVFYVEPEWNDLKIEFTGQRVFRWGIWGTVVTILVIVIYFLYKKESK